MSITATTLSGAVTASATVLGVASATYISAPNPATGSGVTLLMVDGELMYVQDKNGTSISVQRGWQGTRAVAHGASTPVLVGGPSDFAGFVPAQYGESVAKPEKFLGVSAPLTGATIAPDGPWVHFTGTTQLVTITVPSGMVGGEVSIVFDGSGSGLTWTTGGNIAVAGTSTTAASYVTFRYDKSTGYWHPSRLA